MPACCTSSRLGAPSCPTCTSRLVTLSRGNMDSRAVLPASTVKLKVRQLGSSGMNVMLLPDFAMFKTRVVFTADAGSIWILKKGESYNSDNLINFCKVVW